MERALVKTMKTALHLAAIDHLLLKLREWGFGSGLGVGGLSSAMDVFMKALDDAEASAQAEAKRVAARVSLGRSSRGGAAEVEIRRPVGRSFWEEPWSGLSSFFVRCSWNLMILFL